jgi:hypothetical protein
MKISMLITAVVLALPLSVLAAFADTVRKTTRPDGQISFDVSVVGPTRISVVGNRIAKVLQSSSNFEMVNDEGTGDVFLRFAGGQPSRESGYIVTETGHTIGFVMDPKTDLETQTVLITLSGVTTQSSTRSAGGASAAPSTSPGFAVNSGGAGGTRTARLVQFARQAHAARIGTRSPSGQRVGAYRNYSAGGLTARISVASAPGNQPPAERQFYRSSRTLAVFVDRVVAGGKVWVIVVEGSR